MKRIVILMTLVALLVQPALGLIPVAQAQGPDGEGEPEPGGMPGYPAPDKPIPHHEPGQPSRAGSYRTQVQQENELGALEVVEISGVDAMAADGIDPLAGNYTLVNLDKLMMSWHHDLTSFDVQSFELITPNLTLLPGSLNQMGNYWVNDTAAGDLNGDSQDEQVAAWIGEDNHVFLSAGEMPGSLGKTTSVPAAVTHNVAEGTIDLVVRGYDDALWYCPYDVSSSTCPDWSNAAGGLLLSGPAIASRNTDQFDVFAIGSDNLVYQRHWQAGGWSGDWQMVDEPTAWPALKRVVPTPEVPAPAVVARGGEQLDLFRLGPDNTLRWRHSPDGLTWGDWENLGGMLASGPAATSLDSAHMQVFARGVDEALWYLTYDGDWGDWQRLELTGMEAEVTLASAPAAVTLPDGRIVVYARGSDNALWQVQFASGVWGTWNSLGGQLASGAGVAVWSDTAYLFAQKNDGSLQARSDGTSWTDLGGLDIDTAIYDTGSVSITPPGPESLDNLWLDVETGYFTGDGRDQVVVAYQSDTQPNRIRIELYDVQDGFMPSLKLAELEAPIPGYVPRIATGDVNGDGIDEIGIAYLLREEIYRYKVEVYHIEKDMNGNWTGHLIKGRESPTFYSCSGGCGDLDADEHYFAGTMRIVSGDFVAEADQLAREEFAVLSDWVDGRYYEDFDLWVQLYIFDPDVDPGITECRPETDASCPVHNLFRLDSDDDNYWDTPRATGAGLAAGDVNGNGYDEIILTRPTGYAGSDWPDIYRNLSIYDARNVTPQNYHPALVGEVGIPGWQRASFLDTLAVGDLDRDLKDEIVFYTHDQLQFYEFNHSTQRPEFMSSLPLASGDHARSTNLVTGDFTGEGIRVGPPSYRVQNRVDTLVALINMPPKHRDLVKDAAGDYQLIESPVGECSPSPDSPDCTHAKYADKDFESSEQTIRTVHDYEISAGMEAEACAGGGVKGIAEVKACVRTSIDATHGGNFEKSTEEIQSVGFRRKVIAANDDKVVYFGTPYGVWEYPVLSGAAGEASEDVFITVAFPLISITQYPDTSGGYYSGTCDETWFSADHQPNNVWSYDPIGDVTFKDYDPGYELAYDATEGDWAEGEITYDKLQSAFESVTFKHSISTRVETEVTAEAKIKVVDVSGSFKSHVQGDYSNEHMKTDKLTAQKETIFSYFFAPQPDSGKFTTRVLFYRAKDGYQVLNYQAEPGRAASWQLYDKPDPAFILPWYGFPDPDNPQVPPCGEDQKLFSPDIVISPSHASLGDTVTISATVRNFSGEPARDVVVRFYQGDPANNIFIDQTEPIPFLSRESGPEEVSITWTAAGVGRQKIYAVIDPYDAIPEMHDEDDRINNNMAYGLIQLAATNFADMSLVPEQPPYDAISYALGDPKPTVSLYVPRASLDAVARFEVGGTEIGLPVEGRVFEVAAYQGSKYKMWSDPIPNFNLKPGLDDPPAVIIIAYTQADITALAENDLKLYRLEGTKWTEATCRDYQIHRFPEEDLIAVPICQTGIFAFSDVAPGPILGPVAQFSATPLSGPPPLTVTFTDLSSNYPTSWSWDFGDGATSTAQNPTHTYSEPGTYDVSLTVSNEADSDTHTRPNYINVYGMHADFMATPVWGPAPLTVTFTDLSVGIGIPGPTSWAWDFGDGITDTLQHPTHTYTQTGAYSVTLTVSNEFGSDTIIDPNCVTVAGPAPPAGPIYLPLIFKDSE